MKFGQAEIPPEAKVDSKYLTPEEVINIAGNLKVFIYMFAFLMQLRHLYLFMNPMLVKGNRSKLIILVQI